MHTCGDGYCFRKNGWIYLHIEGDPFERGFQHGYLLATELEQALEAIKFYVYGLHPAQPCREKLTKSTML